MQEIEELSAGGSVRMRGPLKFGRLSISGSLKIDGSAEVRNCTSAGLEALAVT